MRQFFENPFTLAGWLLCLAVIIWTLFATINFFRSRRLLTLQYHKENLVLEEKLHLLREKRKHITDDRIGWDGFANFTVVRKVPHGESGICSFYLKPKDERLQLAPFQPGQHLVFQLPVKGGSQVVTRRYSLSDRPGQDYYRVSIKLHEAPADSPGVNPGLGSSYFHNELEDETTSPTKNLIQVSSPAGAFDIDPLDTKPVVLIGGGIGITPMLSMFNSIVEENDTREVWLFYSIRNQSESILFDEDMLHPRVNEVLKNRENVHLHIFYTKIEDQNELPASRESIEQHCGRLTVAGLKTLLPSNNFQFYVCGPEAMMDQFEEEIELWGVPTEDILSERFQPPTRRKAADSQPASNYSIHFSKSGKEIKFSRDDNTILDAAQRAGVPIAYECRAGSCGQCKVGVASGKVSYNIRTNYKCPPGSCLTCSCIPEGDIVLDC